MKKLNKWVDVRKKTSKRSNRYGHNNKKLEEKNTYITLKEVKAVEQPYSVYINGERVKIRQRFYNHRIHTTRQKIQCKNTCK